MAGGGHGSTPAAWTAVTTIFVGSIVSGVALPFSLPWLFFVGVAIMVLGAVAGKVMQLMGMGRPAPQAPEETGVADETTHLGPRGQGGAPPTGDHSAETVPPGSHDGTTPTDPRTG